MSYHIGVILFWILRILDLKNGSLGTKKRKKILGDYTGVYEVMVDCNLFNVNDGSFEANLVETRLTAKFSTSKAKKLLLLPSNFRPSKYDVICHKDREAREHCKSLFYFY